MAASYSIGIDLGTTNCALAYLPLEGSGGETAILEIPQWESGQTLGTDPTLPSFLYRPLEEEAAQLLGKGSGGEWLVGKWARSQTVRVPDRVVHSAKSWLCSHGSDRGARFLPWGSESLSEPEKLSPLGASALLLNYLMGSWEEARGKEAPFAAQKITVTVPASFDAAAQRLTLDAIRDAGFPGEVSLLEEPQAAFYRWLEEHESKDTLEEQLSGLRERPHHVLIVDVGGGTTDFSLFEIKLGKRRKLPDIRRVAVSDHILLGGDNMDLALAHWVESRLEVESLSADQWNHLVAQCRAMKEKVLGVPEEEVSGMKYQVSVPSRGAGLLGGTLRAEVLGAELLEFLLNGFYPDCDSDAVVERAGGALREWGLPYATESGITRHLADFLRERPQVDAILFNGGSLEPGPIRSRLAGLVSRWKGGEEVTVLENPERSLAVARGAARYGLLTERKERRIQADAARSLYLEMQAEGEGEGKLLCILPRGTPREEEVRVEAAGLSVRVNQPVRFRLFSSTRGGREKPGEVVKRNERRHRPMPALQTVIQGQESGKGQVPVNLSSRLNALGLLQVDCVSGEKRWPLEFQLREGTDGVEGESEPVQLSAGVEDERLEDGGKRIASLFGAPWNKRDALTPARLVSSLESILGLPKQDWNAALLRSLWPSLQEHFHDREHSFEHEESWVSLAGLLLRPGFGVESDDERMDQLWEFHDDGFWYPGKAMQLNADVLWRRVAGGLTAQRQEVLAEEAEQRVRQAGKKPPAEAVRLLGALERVAPARKQAMARLLLERALDRLKDGGYAEPFLAALSRLLNRAMLHAGPECVLEPGMVEEVYEALRSYDWADVASGEMVTLFLRAGRQIDDRSLDLDPALRKALVARLRKEGVAPARLTPLEQVVALRDADRVSLFGESLPAGLILSQT